MLEVNNFNAIRISLASPEQIRDWSKGEVTKPETINYRTLRPEKDGLFDERIFGPSRDWECYCGKYKRIRYKGIICDKCGVEVTRAKVRRERMGHIQLASPVSHIWYFKGTPSRLGILLDISPRNLEAVLYFAKYIVTWVDEDARARLLQQLDDEAEGRGGRGGKALSELEDSLQRDLHRQQDELNDGLSAFKKEREEERTARTAELVEAQQAAQAAMDALGSGAADAPIVFEPTGEIIVASGDKPDKAAVTRLKKSASDEIERVNTGIQEREAAEEASVAQQVSDIRLQMDATIEAERERLRTEAEGLKEEIRKAKDEIQRLQAGMLLSETSPLDGFSFRELDRKYGSGVRGAPRLFGAGMGAEAVRERILHIDMEPLGRQLHSEVRTTSGMRRKKAIKRLRLIEAFRRSGTRAEWMIMSVLPVIPPDLRPMVQLDGGRFATSDLNDLYRRVINRNNRLKRLLELGAPEIIIRNEKRMLQEACDALIDNGRRGRAIAGTGNHRLKSLSDMLKGKQGRFRQNLLGKRVDYSGRSVIVVGPELKLHQCGLPKRMALELFKPFVMRRLVAQGLAHNIKSAKRIVERVKPEVWDVLEEVIKDYLVLLNRAPSLHRLSIQAFEAVLIEGSAIQLHPLVCSAFNADFDGDQMAVHVPLSAAAQREARERMLSIYNMLSPANGDPIVSPSQDIVLGCYYMTVRRPGADGEGKAFASPDEAIMAYNSKAINLQAPIFVRMPNGSRNGELIDTTAGRVIFNEILGRFNDDLPDEEKIAYRNQSMDKGALRGLMSECHRKLGARRAAEIADAMKRLGFNYATKSGMSVAISDVEIPKVKEAMLAAADAEVEQVEKNYRRGLITEQERYEEVIRIWNETTDALTNELEKIMDPYGLVYTLANSGATKARFKQIRQLAGMRGLMADPSGRIIDLPIRSNFREGLTVLEYFVSTHGGRKGLADTALRTADAGYLTRRLVDVAQDVIIKVQDCGTLSGIWISSPTGKDVSDSLAARVVGRHAAQPITHPVTGEILLDRNDEITEEVMLAVNEGLEEWLEPVRQKLAKEGKSRDETERLIFEERSKYQINVRTPLMCELEYGVCQFCYGRALHNSHIVDLGEAVGIIAAQSIGEPGTQLTLRTFHTGGVASSEDITQGLPRVEELFEARVPKGQAILAEIDGVVELIEDKDEGRRIKLTYSETYDDDYPLPKNYELLAPEGADVDAGTELFRSLLKGQEADVTVARIGGKVLLDEKKKKLIIRSEERDEREYPIPHSSQIEVREGEHVNAGQPLTKGPQNPQEILHILGREYVQRYLVDEVQRVYRSQGVNVNDKHIEIIVRQMLRKVRIDMPGDTELLPGEMVERFTFADSNARALAAGGEAATATHVLLGITKASLSTDSFLSAASFQETTRVLTEAAINGQVDRLRGLKENVIIGKLIPAGSGTRFAPQLGDLQMVSPGQNIDDYLRTSDAYTGYDGVEAAGMGAAVEGLAGYEGYAFDVEAGDGAGNGTFLEMPDFAPDPDITGVTSAELTAALLEPEATLEAHQTVAEAAATDNELDVDLNEDLAVEPQTEEPEEEPAS